MRVVQMKAYGGPEVLEVVEREAPRPGPGQLLVRVRASSVNPIDWKVRRGDLRLLMPKRMPLVLGVDIAGEVLEAGEGYAAGDRVYGMMPGNVGAYAEVVAVPTGNVARIPDGVSFEEAAATPVGALTSLQSLRDHGKLRAGQRVLVNGASGGVGVFGVQIAKVLGAHVTGVCSAANVGLVRELGADEVVDYKTADFAASGQTWDIVFDAVGTKRFSGSRTALTPAGIYVTTTPSPAVIAAVALNFTRAQKAAGMMVKPSSADLAWVAEQMAAGRVRPVIDRVFPLAEAAEAHRYSETGRARGKIVLRA